MGAVGLNFGSATSGQGFDVTSTVAQIVTNLQAVETPWKTQLTALTSKDTTLTSLGTQISTLSTICKTSRISAARWPIRRGPVPIQMC